MFVDPKKNKMAATRARTSPWPTVAMADALRIVREWTPRKEAVVADAQSREIHGYCIAKEVLAGEPVPSFRASTMDGYAVVGPFRVERTAADGPGVYPVVSAVTAGAEPGFQLRPGSVVRITTGAAVPSGADAVVMVESTRLVAADADGQELSVEIMQGVRPGENVRQVGCDLAEGDAVLGVGDHVGPPEMGLLASLGIGTVTVYARPVVAVLSTGDELVDPATGAAPHGSQVRDSNRPTLLQAIRDAGCTAVDLGIATDLSSTLRATFAAAFDRADVLVTSGGVSMGETDLVKPVLQALGATIHFGRVQMKPGKPMTFATVEWHGRRKLIFSVPGNPVSSTVCFFLFVRPALRYMAGARRPDPPVVPVEVLERWPLDPRPEYVRVHVQLRAHGQLAADPAAPPDPATAPLFTASRTGGQLSSRLMSMRSANGLLVLPSRTEARAEIAVGETVPAILIGGLNG